MKGNRCKHCGVKILKSVYHKDKWFCVGDGGYRCNGHWGTGQLHEPINKSDAFQHLYNKLSQ